MTRRTPSESPGAKRAQELGPEAGVLGVTHRAAEHLTAPVHGHPGGHHHGPGHHLMGHPAFQVGGVQEHVRELDVVETPVPEGGQLLVEFPADAAHLGLGDAGVDAQGHHQVVDLAGGDAVHVGLHDHGEQGPVDPTPALQQRRVEDPLAQLRDLELQGAGLGRQRPGPVAVALGGAVLGAFVAGRPDLLGRLCLDQGLVDELSPLSDAVDVAARADRLQ
jgi:hypothetical protein